jgi:hypothetical protein
LKLQAVIPAKAGIHFAVDLDLPRHAPKSKWIPAFAGMTIDQDSCAGCARISTPNHPRVARMRPLLTQGTRA